MDPWTTLVRACCVCQWADVSGGDVTSLHAIHICTLSQIVCRPIIVVPDNPRTADADGRSIDSVLADTRGPFGRSGVR